MASYSKLDPAGIPYFRFLSSKELLRGQQELPISQRMKSLEKSLCADFLGRDVALKNIIGDYDRRGLYYIPRNIERALLNLESRGKLRVVDPSGTKRTPDRIMPSYRVEFL